MLAFLAGGGEAGALARATDWSKTAIGPVEGWSEALRSTAALVLHNQSPMLLWWGPELVQIYNDAYTPVLGDKHPRAMGVPLRECWTEVFHIVGPMAERPFRGGPASVSDDLQLAIHRKVAREETHFRVAYSPVPDVTVPGTRVGGVLATVTEITEQVYGERQLRTLRELGARNAAGAGTADACVVAAATLGANAWDVPFALLYLVGDGGRRARLAASAGFDLEALEQAAPAEVELAAPGGWPLQQVAETRRVVVLDDLSFCGDALPLSPWSEPPRSAMALPLAAPDQPNVYGVLVCGVSPHRALDDGYRTFFELAAAQVVSAIRNARAYEEEKQRAERLAEADRAKTAFFSNVSHEFRTPLTLMLGPTEDALQAGRALAGEELRAVHRNELRLLGLVNSLLDFSRMEAGRAQASFEPTDLASLTSDVASAFRAAVESAGLRYHVDCAPLEEPLFVDRALWEKIVLNLLSNALKFTFEGEIGVTLRATGEGVELQVRDTGTGIARHELPRMFERFHRIEGARGRTHEGSGIGLALVAEIVALHGGTVGVESVAGSGSTFTVRLPRGRAHLPAGRVVARPTTPPAATAAHAWVEEALRWLPATEVEPAAVGGARVLVADDNADMRDYLRRVLSPHWTVETAGDGLAALEAARRALPDLVVTDVMMPGLDGFGLLRALREDEGTRALPVIVLSARAGDEARVDGLQAGADDYLVKPFSARELVARVRTHLELARLRRAAELEASKLNDLLEQAPAAICVLSGPDHVYRSVNAAYREAVGDRPLLGLPIREARPELAGQEMLRILDRAYATGERVVGSERRSMLQRGDNVEDTYWNYVQQPYRDFTGAVAGVMVFSFEVTTQVQARQRAEALAREVEQSRAALDEANRAKDEFLAMLGHELRNPLAPIFTALQVMRLRDDAASANERAIVERQALHLVRLVDDLLDVSRITRGKIELRKQRVEIGQVVSRALEMASPLLEQRRHTLRVDVAGGGMVVDGDPDRLAQVLSNLLTNAAKYTEQGGRITVTAGRIDDEVVIGVEDTGIGIAPEMLPRVFEMFVQDKQAIDRAQGGLGLGLTIVRSLVALHGGHVEVASEGRHRGARFTVRLPAAPATAASTQAVSAALTDVELRSRRILVVDDNQDAADLMAESLDLVGHVVGVAYDGPQALKIVGDFAPEVALVDIGLPVMDGYELARRLRELPGLAALRIVAVTGYGQATDRVRTRDAGFDAHLVKPVDMRRVTQVIGELGR